MNTPTTDAATHDDWSGGAEATEPEVSRALESFLRTLIPLASIHLEQPHDMSEDDFFNLKMALDSARNYLQCPTAPNTDSIP